MPLIHRSTPGFSCVSMYLSHSLLVLLWNERRRWWARLSARLLPIYTWHVVAILTFHNIMVIFFNVRNHRINYPLFVSLLYSGFLSAIPMIDRTEEFSDLITLFGGKRVEPVSPGIWFLASASKKNIYFFVCFVDPLWIIHRNRKRLSPPQISHK